MVLTSRTGRSSPSGVSSRGATSTALGSTATSAAAGRRRATWSAATPLTALQPTGAARSPATSAASLATGAQPSQNECTVTTVATPRRAATAATREVNGASTEMWAWTTS